MTITTTGGLTPNPLVPGAYILVGDATMSGTGTTSVAASAAGTLTVTGAGTAIEFSNIDATAAVANVAVTGGAHATVDSLTGVSLLSTFSIGDASTLTLGAGINVGVLPTIDFGGSSGTLELAPGSTGLNVGEQITNFGPASTITFDGSDYTGGSYANGALTLTGPNGATTTVPLAADAAFPGAYFHVTSNGGNTSLILNNVAAGGIPACYLRGTMILTDTGERPVEDLVIGDRLVTLSGQSRAVRWIGVRSYAGRFLAANPGVKPVRIKAGALADCQPKRDLLVSPMHAMLLDGMLIPAGTLINGGSIATDCSVGEVHYYHLELESHDVIWAEGAPSETYLDDDNRNSFHNAASYYALYSDAGRPRPEYCFPLMLGGDAVEATWSRLSHRGMAMASQREPLAQVA